VTFGRSIGIALLVGGVLVIIGGLAIAFIGGVL